MKKIILLKGLPASGKTTWAKKMVSDNPGMYKRVNKDDLRAMLDNGKWSKHNEKFIIQLRDQIIINALNSGQHVIVDDTNLNKRHEKMMITIAKDNNAIVEVKEFDTDYKECIKRDAKRENSVGEKVIKDMYNKYLKADPEPIKYNPCLKQCIIVDIDGTLAKMNDRSPYDWGKVGEDSVHKHIKGIVDMYYEDFDIIIMTGRDGCCENETREWLSQNGIGYTALHIRPEGNNESDVIIKERMYREHIEGKYNVEFVLDDRDCVVEMWRNLGLKCLQVNYGDF